MDIEPLWALGGWFLLPNCMAAAPKTSSSPPSSPSISEFPTKVNPNLLLFLALVFFIFLLLVSPSSMASSSSSASPITSKRLLSEPSSKSTINFHPKNTKNPTTTTSSSNPSARREFGAEAHEVPSGPNPISN
ncbi:CLAVATA3/ESR (CLE)-related protein 44 [Pyrus ussuriensis x Pyrus communis]|uniref:CLAVATA3/ESR (CLE)-related protein 44 n=1 Tax=Pyrus ussuriensis x Pyrus communis TaxID=2448454 RepID=A0A5N5INL0_9ROSA|nr:CLAVATA3/ESR (CLE)-related protein 44 [Pyrus ussuriensis x Pyrus communis]